jgi:hypothetical protein
MALDAKALVPPALAFLFGRLVLFAAGMRAFRGSERAERWSLDAWVRWDSQHYLDIARDGYQLFRCAGRPGYPAEAWCGNAGWFPAYPLLLRPLERIGCPLAPAAVVLSGLFAFLALHALWTRLLERRPGRGALLALAIAAVAPGVVYQHAAFPISMLLFLQIRALDALLRGRGTVAGLWGAAASFTYPSGLLLAVVIVGYGALVRRAFTARRFVSETLVPAALTALGTGLVLVLHQLEVGDWQAFFKVQRKYGFGLHWPHETLLGRLAALWSSEALFPALQTLLVALLMLGVLLALVVRRSKQGPADVLVSLHALCYWLFPLVLGGGLSLHRADALLMPAALLTRHLPAPLQLGLLGASAFAAVRMGARFFRGVLV